MLARSRRYQTIGEGQLCNTLIIPEANTTEKQRSMPQTMSHTRMSCIEKAKTVYYSYASVGKKPPKQSQKYTKEFTEPINQDARCVGYFVGTVTSGQAYWKIVLSMHEDASNVKFMDPFKEPRPITSFGHQTLAVQRMGNGRDRKNYAIFWSSEICMVTRGNWLFHQMGRSKIIHQINLQGGLRFYGGTYYDQVRHTINDHNW